MTYKEAIDARNKYKPDLVGQKMKGVSGFIKDVIVSPPYEARKVYSLMTSESIPNEAALSRVNNVAETFEVYVVSEVKNGRFDCITLTSQLQSD